MCLVLLNKDFIYKNNFDSETAKSVLQFLNESLESVYFR
jgi:hypothetical protein